MTFITGNKILRPRFPRPVSLFGFHSGLVFIVYCWVPERLVIFHLSRFSFYKSRNDIYVSSLALPAGKQILSLLTKRGKLYHINGFF